MVWSIPYGFTRILVEVLTSFNGKYVRFLVLVGLGIGCTVWYTVVPTSTLHEHASTFGVFNSYEPIYNIPYYAPGFHRVGFVESKDVSASVESILANELPFAEMIIPARGPMLNAVVRYRHRQHEQLRCLYSESQCHS